MKPQENLVRIRVPACDSGVVAVRQALAGLCDAVARQRADDVRVAVTEACDGVCRFAVLNTLADQDIDVEAVLSDTALTVIVRGAGAGLPTTGSTSRRVRASLMGAVADQMTVVPRTAKQGTETRLTFFLDHGVPLR